MSGVALFDDLIVSRETIERLECYGELLQKWSRSINLVAKSTLSDAWTRHILDSAQVFLYIPDEARRIVDLGSGAGFPGLVLGILALERAQPYEVLLVESDRRKALFLREVIRETGARATVAIQRVEALDCEADVVTARGFTALDRLLTLASPIMGQTGIALLHKGARYESELTDASQSWHMEVERYTSRIDPASVILRLSGIKGRQGRT